MNRQQTLGVACGLVLVAVMGCTPVVLPTTPQSPAPQAPDGEATVVAPQTPTSTPELSVDTSAVLTREETVTIDRNAPDGDASNPQVLQAIEDLAARTSLPIEEIEVVSSEAVVWPDKGLGCPQPGMVYPQVQQDGMLIHLQAGGVVYEYHSGEGQMPVLCENGVPAKPR